MTHITRRLQRHTFDIWAFQRTLSRRLLWWAGANIIGGLWLQQRRNKFWRGVAMQAITWGAINAGIALVGSFFSRRRQATLDKPYARTVIEQEKRTLLRTLWINAGLDVLYVVGGVVLAWTRGSKDRLMRGNGWGIVLQGTFLCVFDIIHALVISSEDEDTN